MANNQPTIEQVRRVECPECGSGAGAPCLEFGWWGTKGRHKSQRARKHHHIERVLAMKGIESSSTQPDGIVQIEKGDPRYCPITVQHEPHRFCYSIDNEKEQVDGWYDCDGTPTFPAQPEATK